MILLCAFRSGTRVCSCIISALADNKGIIIVGSGYVRDGVSWVHNQANQGQLGPKQSHIAVFLLY